MHALCVTKSLVILGMFFGVSDLLSVEVVEYIHPTLLPEIRPTPKSHSKIINSRKSNVNLGHKQEKKRAFEGSKEIIHYSDYYKDYSGNRHEINIPRDLGRDLYPNWDSDMNPDEETTDSTTKSTTTTKTTAKSTTKITSTSTTTKLPGTVLDIGSASAEATRANSEVETKVEKKSHELIDSSNETLIRNIPLKSILEVKKVTEEEKKPAESILVTNDHNKGTEVETSPAELILVTKDHKENKVEATTTDSILVTNNYNNETKAEKNPAEPILLTKDYSKGTKVEAIPAESILVTKDSSNETDTEKNQVDSVLLKKDINNLHKKIAELRQPNDSNDAHEQSSDEQNSNEAGEHDIRKQFERESDNIAHEKQATHTYSHERGDRYGESHDAYRPVGDSHDIGEKHSHSHDSEEPRRVFHRLVSSQSLKVSFYIDSINGSLAVSNITATKQK